LRSSGQCEEPVRNPGSGSRDRIIIYIPVSEAPVSGQAGSSSAGIYFTKKPAKCVPDLYSRYELVPALEEPACYDTAVSDTGIDMIILSQEPL
jgi:hypothetical protein